MPSPEEPPPPPDPHRVLAEGGGSGPFEPPTPLPGDDGGEGGFDRTRIALIVV
jgi:hypothetical protein